MGDCTDRYAFTAFGELLEHQGEDPNAYLFAGEQLDPNSGFYYNRARWMDPGVGRFVSMDPYGGRAFEPITLHKYLYANVWPVNATDPTGLSSLIDVTIATLVRVIVFTWQHPVLAGVIGVVGSALVPEDFANALQQATGPYGFALSAPAQARARFFTFVKSRWFQNFFRTRARERGYLAKRVGDWFEEFLKEELLRGGTGPNLIPGTRNSFDIDWKGLFIEAKSGLSWGARERRQLAAIAKHAKNMDRETFVYIFLTKPSQSVVDEISDKGGQPLWLFERVFTP